MATTYEAIATVEVGSGGAANIDFTSIPATYTDLCIKASARFANSTTQGLAVKFNGASTTNHIVSCMDYYGSASGSYTDTVIFANANANSSTASTFGNFEDVYSQLCWF
jgi:hypothetical protein